MVTKIMLEAGIESVKSVLELNCKNHYEDRWV